MYGCFLGDDMVARLSPPNFQVVVLEEASIYTCHLLGKLRASLPCALRASLRMNCRELKGLRSHLTHRALPHPWTQGQGIFTVLWALEALYSIPVWQEHLTSIF